MIRCTKRRYKTEFDAMVAEVQCEYLREIQGKKNRQERRFYQCERCRCWHLTSQENASAEPTEPKEEK